MNLITTKLNPFIRIDETPRTVVPDKNVKPQTLQQAKQTGDTVNLSSEGKAKAAEDEIKSLLNKALHDIVINDSEVNKAAGEDPLDTQIKVLQEKIRELNQSIKKLKGKDDEISIKQKEALIEQRNEYTFQLLELYNQKLQESKSS